MVCKSKVLRSLKPPPHAASRFLALSFSGAGHLLPYHLGVASSLLHRSRVGNTCAEFSAGGDSAIGTRADGSKGLPRVEAVSGSSSGAIAAVAYARLPDRIDEFADRFIAERGRALALLREMLHDAERRDSNSAPELAGAVPAEVDDSRHGIDQRGRWRMPSLHVAATRCSDGSLHLFSFPRRNGVFRTISASWNTDRMLRCVEASCRIPPSFHPIDVTPGFFGGSPATYPAEEGVIIDGEGYVDGGIAAPAPPTPHDKEERAIRVIVSPISGGLPTPVIQAELGDGVVSLPWTERISPEDGSWNLLPVTDICCNGGFRVRPSLQNLRAMRTSMGVASEEELRGWYEGGCNDGKRMAARLASYFAN